LIDPEDDMPSPSPSQAPAARLVAVFAGIHRERMTGLPILNPRLAVAAVGGRVWGDHWIGVLVTPWCMNLVALPLNPSGPEQMAGDPLTLEFPAGRFAFAVSSEPGLGTYAACSLFSPMGEFPDQETALAIARATLDALFEVQSGVGQGASSDSRGTGISRRDLLRGGFGRPNRDSG
jgi:[NiFe] hydrogenase assembly HybE family chaperone